MKRQAEEEASVSDVQGVIQPTLTEERIREIVREEIEKSMQQRLNWLRVQTGLRNYEAK